MKKIVKVNKFASAVSFISLWLSASTAMAQSPGVPVRGAAPVWGNCNPSLNSGMVPGYRNEASPFYNQYYNPNNNYYYAPSGTVYGAYPYSNYAGRYNFGGVNVPVYGAPTLMPGGYYGMNVGGAPYQFWRAPSGFYYPWVGGYAYNSYPIYTTGPQSTPTQTLPPISTVISDLDSYLDKAKSKGKVSTGDYQDLRQRANDLLSKDKSLAYEEGGSLDPDQEAQMRRDVEELSAEVAHRVKP